MIASIRNNTLRLLWTVLGLLGCLLFSACHQPVAYTAQQGQIDLSDWQVQQQPVVALQGEWLIDWGQGLETVPVPRSWESHLQQVLPLQRSGVYQLSLNLPTAVQGRPLKILMPDQTRPHYRVWVDQLLVAQNGSQLNPVQISRSRLKSQTTFEAPAQQVVLRIEMQALGEYRNGLHGPVMLGLADAIDHQLQRQQVALVFLLGAIFMFMLYHLFLYVQRPHEKSLLYFGILCGLAILYFDSISAHLVEIALGELPFEITLRASRMACYAFLPICVLYVCALFPDIRIRFLVPFYLSTGLFFLLSLFLPIYWASAMFGPYLLLGVFAHLNAFWLPFRTLSLQRKEAGLFLISSLIFSLACLYDTFYEFSWIPYGYLVFCLGQAVMLAQRFRDDYLQVKVLSQRLEESNLLLEQRVLERTERLKQQSERLKTLGVFKEKIAHMLAHDLKTPLSAILFFSKEESFQSHYLSHIRQACLNMQTLIQQLLSSKDLQRFQLPVNVEPVPLAECLAQALGVFLPWMQTQNVQLVNQVASETLVLADRLLLFRVFQNLVSNALKSMPEGGQLTIQTRLLQNELEVSLQDTGVGIEAEWISDAFEWQTHRFSEAEMSSDGLGLPFCKLAIEAQGGMIALENTAQGTCVRFTLPQIIPIPSVDWQLTPQDIQRFKPFGQRLASLALYEISDLLTVIDEMEALASPELRPFLHALRQAVEDFDSNQFESLLKVLHTTDQG